MKDFISEIRKIPTDRVLYTFSRISIDMFKKLECKKPVPLVVERNGRVMRGEVLLTGWDIHSIMYLSVKHSNDYRNCNKMISVPEIINLFRRYDDENSAAEDLRASQLDGVFRILMGMTSEQFLFQQPGLVFEKFNRDYYILLAADSFEHRHLLDVNSVVDSIFGYSANDYIAVLLMVFWLCSQSPDPISVIDSANLDNVSRLLSKENLTKFIQYYSCTYNELRESKLGKQMLYSKPFIKTQNTGAYISANMFLFY